MPASSPISAVSDSGPASGATAANRSPSTSSRTGRRGATPRTLSTAWACSGSSRMPRASIIQVISSGVTRAPQGAVSEPSHAIGVPITSGSPLTWSSRTVSVPASGIARPVTARSSASSGQRIVNRALTRPYAWFAAAGLELRKRSKVSRGTPAASVARPSEPGSASTPPG